MNVKCLTLSGALVLCASAALAQGILDAGSKMRGDYEYPSRMMQRATVYQAPLVVEQSPVVAQAPADRRSFSYNPAPAPPMQEQPAASTAPPRRSFSYEPGTAPAPVYSGNNYRGAARRGNIGGILDAATKVSGNY